MTNTITSLTRILCANIGNRNITWEGRYFADLSEVEKAEFGGTFKTFSQKMLDEFEHFAPALGCTIVNQILDHYRKQELAAFDHVILYGSKQPTDDHSRTDQDTYWAAQVMALILVRNGLLKENQVQVHSVNFEISDNDGLMRYYREALRTLNRTHEYPHVSICDAGGSPQQKVALKIMAEFMVDDDRLEVLYVNAKKQTVETVSQIEYRNIIVAEQVRSLVSRGQYKAALSLRKIEDRKSICTARKLSDRLTGVGYLLSIGNYTYYQFSLKNMKVKDRARLAFLPDEPDDLNVKLAKAQFLYRAGQFDSAILSYAVFYESYLNEVISSQLGYDLVKNYHEENQRLAEEAFERFDNIRHQFDKQNFSDVKFKVAVAMNIPGEAHQTFLATLDPFIRGVINREMPLSGVEALNSVRNKIAHQGFIPDNEYMKKELAYFPELIGAAGQLRALPSTNLFEAINEAIYHQL